MLSKSKGQVLKVAVALHVLFGLEISEEMVFKISKKAELGTTLHLGVINKVGVSNLTILRGCTPTL